MYAFEVRFSLFNDLLPYRYRFAQNKIKRKYLHFLNYKNFGCHSISRLQNMTIKLKCAWLRKWFNIFRGGSKQWDPAFSLLLLFLYMFFFFIEIVFMNSFPNLDHLFFIFAKKINADGRIIFSRTGSYLKLNF